SNHRDSHDGASHVQNAAKTGAGQQEYGDITQPSEISHYQSVAQEWQNLAERQERIVQILHAAAVHQRGILPSWEAIDAMNSVDEIRAVEEALQHLLRRAVGLVGQALENEHQNLHRATVALDALRPSGTESSH